jgi:hypothetical protein
VLKSNAEPLVLDFEEVSLCKKGDCKGWLRLGDHELDHPHRNPQLLIAEVVENLPAQRKPSRKFPIKLLKFPSFFRNCSTFRIE